MEDASAGYNDFIHIKGLPFKNPDGLEFCAHNSLYYKVNRSPLISTLPVLNILQGVRDIIQSSIDRPR